MLNDQKPTATMSLLQTWQLSTQPAYFLSLSRHASQKRRKGSQSQPTRTPREGEVRRHGGGAAVKASEYRDDDLTWFNPQDFDLVDSVRTAMSSSVPHHAGDTLNYMYGDTNTGYTDDGYDPSVNENDDRKSCPPSGINMRGGGFSRRAWRGRIRQGPLGSEERKISDSIKSSNNSSLRSAMSQKTKMIHANSNTITDSCYTHDDPHSVGRCSIDGDIDTHASTQTEDLALISIDEDGNVYVVEASVNAIDKAKEFIADKERRQREEERKERPERYTRMIDDVAHGELEKAIQDQGWRTEGARRNEGREGESDEEANVYYTLWRKDKGGNHGSAGVVLNGQRSRDCVDARGHEDVGVIDRSGSEGDDVDDEDGAEDDRQAFILYTPRKEGMSKSKRPSAHLKKKRDATPQNHPHNHNPHPQVSPGNITTQNTSSIIDPRDAYWLDSPS